MLDRHRRPLRSLRISVTDRCNLRCGYCMPEEKYAWLPRSEILHFEEIAEIAAAFVAEGVDRIRLTGGEPLLRSQLPELVRQLAGVPDLSLTTNGVLLADQAQGLRDAGLGRITVSLDTLRQDRFREMTRRDDHGAVLRGIEAAREAGLPLKLDAVVLRGKNDDEIAELLAFATERGAELRFIEYMDVGGATRWSRGEVVSRQEILAAVEARFGPARPLPGRGSAPAERFELSGGGTFGIIASTTAPFCGACDRARLTADGTLYLCLYAETGVSLRDALRAGESRDQLRARIRASWGERVDRGAEERLGVGERGPLRSLPVLRADPRLEMHTRGG